MPKTITTYDAAAADNLSATPHGGCIAITHLNQLFYPLSGRSMMARIGSGAWGAIITLRADKGKQNTPFSRSMARY